MSNELQIYRKRLIPEECILLKDDIIVEQNEDYILTKCCLLYTSPSPRD